MLISLGGDSLLIFWSESYDIMLNEIFSSDESSTTTANCILAETYLCKISQWFCAECKRIEQFQPDKRLIEVKLNLIRLKNVCSFILYYLGIAFKTKQRISAFSAN